MTHSYVQRDWLTFATWLIYICNRTLACVTWLIHTCKSASGHCSIHELSSCMRVRMFECTHVNTFIRVCAWTHIHMWIGVQAHLESCSHVQRARVNAFTCVRVRMFECTQVNGLTCVPSYVWLDSYSHVWRDAFKYARRDSSMCCHDSFTRATRHIHPRTHRQTQTKTTTQT